MPNILDRPYQGNYQPNARRVVKYTPDALLYVNGDISIPGCPRCNGRIDLQQYVTGISVEAGTNPGAHSGSAQLTIPASESLFREGRFLIQPAMEVHVYMRGYFPVQGQFSHLPVEQGRNAFNLDRYATYPYYHVFHGVITQVSLNYSDGFYSASLSFASMLHFWQYHNMSMNGAALANKPDNSGVQPNLWGNIYSNMTPYAIIYDLYRSVIGAAGGIERHFREETNVDAVVKDAGNRQVYSMLQMYWEDRFKTSVQNLRMYGVNGRLFNAVQQAYIGRRNSTKINNLLKHVQHLDLDALSNQVDPFAGQFSAAKSIGLVGGGLDLILSERFADRRGSEYKDSLSLNITSMYAFTVNVSSANLQLWEGTYQTKLEIAQQVTQATGFEFYQDVDGDLVFKPPFYNLDTRSSRVYRIEDIDIINISFQQKEPQATYCVVKAGALVGVHTGATEGWIGSRGTYIDWRLVAKFGWRPAHQEVSYFNNPRALFFLAQSRLDLLNIDINSASLTIPLRPELRPGYPVYIPFIDCYYYVTSLSHSFSYGSQCTTTLTLTGRRAKFFAPGVPGRLADGGNAINNIRLDEPYLPERPLEIYENGYPRWAGFPNVVMALDPTRANPKMFMLKSGLESLGTQINGQGDVEMLFDIIRSQVRQARNGAGIFSVVSSEDSSVPTKDMIYAVRWSDNPGDYLEFTLEDLLQDFKAFDQVRRELEKTNKRIASLNEDLRRTGQPSGLAGDLQRRPTNADKIQARLQAAHAQAHTIQQSLSPEGEGANNKLLMLLHALQHDSVRGALDSVPDAPSTIAWLEILSDTKSNMLGGSTLPGYYRYYSASHPNPEMQGMATLHFDEGSGDDLSANQNATLNIPAASSGADIQAEEDPSAPQSDVADELKATEDGRVVRRGPKRNISRFVEGSMDRKQGRQEFEEVGQRAVQLGVPEEYVQFMRVQIQTETGGTFNPGAAYVPFEGRRGAERRAMQNVKNKYGADVFANNPAPADHWYVHAGWFQFIAPYGMSQFVDTECVNKDPYILFDPDYAMAANLMAMRRWQRILTGESHGLPPEERTWSRIRQGQGPGVKYINPDSPANQARSPEEQAKIRATHDRWNAAMQRAAQRVGVDPEFIMEGRPPSSNSWGYPNPGEFNPCAFAQALKDLRAQEASPQNQLTPPPSTTKPFVPPVEDPPSITLVENRLDGRRPVQGFIDGPLRKPSGVTRAPEAQLGDVYPERGIKVVVARASQTEVVDTSQIQAVTFTRSEATKAVAVEGLANEQGIYEPGELASFLQKNLTTRFEIETEPHIFGLSASPADFIAPLYNEIRDALMMGVGEDPQENADARSFPVFESVGAQESPTEAQYTIAHYAVVALPEFSQAVSTQEVFVKVPPIGPGFQAVSVSLSANRPAAHLSLSELGKAPPFQGENLEQIVGKVIAAYVRVITDFIVQAFVAARASAGFVSGKRPFGFSDRMALVSDAFSAIALEATTVPFEVRGRQSSARAVRQAKKNRGIFTPVFPVSDAAGYEHIGSFRYGRGLTIDPGGTFDSINNSPDPFSGVSAATAEAFLNALTSVHARLGSMSQDKREALLAERIEDLRERQQDLEGQVLGGSADLNPNQRNNLFEQNVRRIAQVRLALQEVAKANPDALAELEQVNNLEQGTLLMDSPNPNLFETKFANFPANQLRSGVLKTTVANAAYNLVDLEPHLKQKAHMTCSCLGAASSILLQAYSRNDFMAIAEIDPDKDPATASVSEQILQSMPEYIQQRQALRGQQLDTRGSSLSEAFGRIRDVRNSFTGTGESLRDVRDQIRGTAPAFRDIRLGGD